MSELRDLDRADCLGVLADASVGRVAVSTPDGPHILPVNFALVDDTVAIRTSAYSILGTYARDAVIALEVDHFEPQARRGWSIVVRGRCHVETDPRMLVRLRAALSGGWVGGARTLYLRLGLEQVSGRAVGGAVVVAPRRPSPV